MGPETWLFCCKPTYFTSNRTEVVQKVQKVQGVQFVVTSALFKGFKALLSSNVESSFNTTLSDIDQDVQTDWFWFWFLCGPFMSEHVFKLPLNEPPGEEPVQLFLMNQHIWTGAHLL